LNVVRRGDKERRWRLVKCERRTVAVAGSIWDEQKVLGKVRADVKRRVAGGWRG
jgi:hypothetical protein